jgi:hypothetical protein
MALNYRWRRRGAPPGLFRESVEDIDQLGKALAVLGFAEGRPVRDAALDVEAQNAQTDAVESGLGSSELLQNLHAEARFLHHPANAADLSFDPVQAGHKGLLLWFVQHDFMLICGTSRLFLDDNSRW